MNKKIIEDVINRLYNCKFDSAYEYLKTIDDVPKEILKEFEKASEDLGNCGWGGNLIINMAQKLANLLGYEYDVDEDYFIKK